MGYAYEPEGNLNFFSRKLGLLKRAIGNTVWVVQGEPLAKGTVFTLVGSYLAEKIETADEKSGLYLIKGHGLDCLPPIPLNAMPWFSELKKAQSNFSLGFNTLNDSATVAALQKISLVNAEISQSQFDVDSDIDSPSMEGRQLLVLHLSRERNSKLARLKKQQVLSESGGLKCEVCNFDFATKYGELGVGFCEVHHRLPLGERVMETETTLADLAIVCANCHRMIHRTSPILSVEDMRALLTNINS